MVNSSQGYESLNQDMNQVHLISIIKYVQGPLPLLPLCLHLGGNQQVLHFTANSCPQKPCWPPKAAGTVLAPAEGALPKPAQQGSSFVPPSLLAETAVSSSKSPRQILNLCGSKIFTVCSDISHVELQKPRLLEAQRAQLPAEAGHLSSSTLVTSLLSSQPKALALWTEMGFASFLCVSVKPRLTALWSLLGFHRMKEFCSKLRRCSFCTSLHLSSPKDKQQPPLPGSVPKASAWLWQAKGIPW